MKHLILLCWLNKLFMVSFNCLKSTSGSDSLLKKADSLWVSRSCKPSRVSGQVFRSIQCLVRPSVWSGLDGMMRYLLTITYFQHIFIHRACLMNIFYYYILVRFFSYNNCKCSVQACNNWRIIARSLQLLHCNVIFKPFLDFFLKSNAYHNTIKTKENKNQSGSWKM